MSKIELYQQRIQRKINPGDKRFNVNTIDFTIKDGRLYFHNSYCYNKKYDFILLDNHTLKIGLQHQHLSKGIMDCVIGAGTIVIDKNGLITYLDNQSGTFQFTCHEQQDYLVVLNAILNIQNLLVYDVDYTIPYDPVKPTINQAENRYYNPKQYSDNIADEYLQDMSLEKWRWVQHQNQFDPILYFYLNEDIKGNWDMFKKERLYYHFGNWGQYERGRCMGYYSDKETIDQ